MGNIVALITARGGSKGIPKKNICNIGGKPLIQWTIEASQNTPELSYSFLSTDDLEIAEVGKKYGVDVPFIRPPELAADDTAHVDVIRHACTWLLENKQDEEFDYLVLLQPTSPFRTHEDISAAIRIARDTGGLAVISICETHHHPFLMKKIGSNGMLESFAGRSVAVGSQQIRRQEMPKAYFVNGAIYVIRIAEFLKTGSMMPKETYPYIMPASRSLQIDEPYDAYLADLIFKGMHKDI
jgi:CMP-N,N'-diacetyllegionaminic acid synthase